MQATAALELGNMLRDTGDEAAARAAYERALEFDEPAVTPYVDESLELLRRSTKSTDPSTAIIGMGLLGERADDPAEAIHWFAQAAELGVPGHSDAACGRLGEQLLAQGDRDAARIEFERVSRCDVPGIAARGEFGLGLIRYEEDDLAGAVAAFVKTASYASDDDLGEDALNNVRVVLDGQRAAGDHLGAATTLRRLAEVVPEAHVAEWAYETATEFIEAEDNDAALIYLRCAVEIGAPEPAPEAVLALGECCTSAARSATGAAKSSRRANSSTGRRAPKTRPSPTRQRNAWPS
ncbi:hypothetical protein FDZ84_22740 [Saccharopolyspora sp. ASAGF58]|nr:hypothetical protein FDZ84_22740 [Saccharopolyspora sp. ASAGF58]